MKFSSRQSSKFFFVRLARALKSNRQRALYSYAVAKNLSVTLTHVDTRVRLVRSPRSLIVRRLSRFPNFLKRVTSQIVGSGTRNLGLVPSVSVYRNINLADTWRQLPVTAQNIGKAAHHLGEGVSSRWGALTSMLVSLYSWSLTYPGLERYSFSHRRGTVVPSHALYFTFTGSRLVISLRDSWKDLTHLFASPGLFLRYFEGRKSLKRKRALMVLMVKFVRKILLVLKLSSVNLYVRGVPVYFDTLLSTLFRPLSHSIVNPLNGESLSESSTLKSDLGFESIQFLTSKPFGYQKPRKRGRVKRKIRRKISQTGSVVDAF